MSINSLIRGKVSLIAEANSMDEFKAFAFWFLEEIEDYSQEQAREIVIDGPWDNGIDAIDLDEETKTLSIYQFKYSEDEKYVGKGFSDVQRGIVKKFENTDLEKIEKVRVFVVALTNQSDYLIRRKKNSQRKIKEFIDQKKAKVDLDFEFYDLKKFNQLYEKVYGIEVSLEFRHEPVVVDQVGIIGLIDSFGLKGLVKKEDLFAFNIRKFLGIRKGSVNSSMKETLESEYLKGDFWKLNNGIVCLCTDWKLVSPQRIFFDNFTIVNGAQTVNTISRFFDDNPADKGPVWIFSKIIKVSENEIDIAKRITKTSNNQNQINSKDLCASDSIHRKLELWIQEKFDLSYVYRRGLNSEKKPSKAVIQMKDLAQAFIAFWKEEPNISFSQPGKIFSDQALYGYVFPVDEIDKLSLNSKNNELLEFLEMRILCWKTLSIVRKEIDKIDLRGELRKFRSLVYHIVWIYRKIFENENFKDLIDSSNVESVVCCSFDDIFKGVRDFSQKSDIPRDLKSTVFLDLLRQDFFGVTRYEDAIQKIKTLFSLD